MPGRVSVVSYTGELFKVGLLNAAITTVPVKLPE
jgi:hypothetical protein